MARTDKSNQVLDRDNLTPTWSARNNEFAVANRLAGEDITAYRACKINANNQMQIYRREDVGKIFAPASTAGYSKGDEGLFIAHGPAKLEAQGGRLEPQTEFKVGIGGKITRFCKISDGSRTIISATAGEAGEITDTDANDEKVKVVSSDSSDSSLWVLVLGKAKTTGAAQAEYIYLNGTTSSSGSLYWDEVYAAVILDAPNIDGTATNATGNVTVKNVTSGTTLITISAGANHMGLIAVTDTDCYDTRCTVAIDSLPASASEIILYGVDENGDETGDILAWGTSGDILKKESSERFNRIVWVAGGGIPDANTITITANSSETIFDGWTNNVGHVTYTAGNQQADAQQKLISDEAGADGKVYIIGYDDTTIVTEEVTLNGTTAVDVSTATDAIIGAYVKSGTVEGTISILNSDGTTVVGTFDTASYNSWGLVERDEADATTSAQSALGLDAGNNKVKITSSNSSATDKVIIIGKDRDGSAQKELLTLSSGAAESTKYWSIVDYIACVDQASTEYLKLHYATEDDGSDAKGLVLSPADAAGDKVEVFIY